MNEHSANPSRLSSRETFDSGRACIRPSDCTRTCSRRRPNRSLQVEERGEIEKDRDRLIKRTISKRLTKAVNKRSIMIDSDG